MKTKVRFNIDRNVEAQGEIVQRFKAGEVYELSATSARRWIRRGVATEVQGSAKKPAAPKSKPKVEEKPKPAVGERKPPITASATTGERKPITANSKSSSE